jgi:hypothetical protein
MNEKVDFELKVRNNEKKIRPLNKKLKDFFLEWISVSTSHGLVYLFNIF